MILFFRLLFVFVVLDRLGGLVTTTRLCFSSTLGIHGATDYYYNYFCFLIEPASVMFTELQKIFFHV